MKTIILFLFCLAAAQAQHDSTCELLDTSKALPGTVRITSYNVPFTSNGRTYEEIRYSVYIRVASVCQLCGKVGWDWKGNGSTNELRRAVSLAEDLRRTWVWNRMRAVDNVNRWKKPQRVIMEMR